MEIFICIFFVERGVWQRTASLHGGYTVL